MSVCAAVDARVSWCVVLAARVRMYGWAGGLGEKRVCLRAPCRAVICSCLHACVRPLPTQAMKAHSDAIKARQQGQGAAAVTISTSASTASLRGGDGHSSGGTARLSTAGSGLVRPPSPIAPTPRSTAAAAAVARQGGWAIFRPRAGAAWGGACHKRFRPSEPPTAFVTAVQTDTCLFLSCVCVCRTRSCSSRVATSHHPVLAPSDVTFRRLRATTCRGR